MSTSKLQSANLVLSHAQISTTGISVLDETATSDVGNWTLDKANTVWKINMRTLMGGLWDKYTLFGIRLNQHAYEQITAWQLNTDNLLVSYNIIGLNWVNCSYAIQENQNIRAYNFYNCLLGVDGGVTNLSPTQSIGYFYKGPDNVDITIEMRQMLNPTKYTTSDSGKTIPAHMYKFDIFPIE